MTSDRLRFRAYFENATLYDEDGNEYTKSFYLYDIAIYKDRDCGISREDLENQLEKQGFSKREIEYIEDCEFDCYDGSWEAEWFWFAPSAIEQGTGLKDKHGKLIFEGDIVSCLMNSPRKGVVEFYRNAFCLNENGSYSEDIVFSEKCCEVIGNVHKNAE